MRKNSIKNIRINEEVMRELSNIIRGEIKDPRINPTVSYTHLGIFLKLSNKNLPVKKNKKRNYKKVQRQQKRAAAGAVSYTHLDVYKRQVW